MAEIKLTPSQDLAVKARGSTLLVSAAAGSGKTRVLTERLMSYVADGEKPCDIDGFLVITYTRAAAAELRGRVLDELGSRVAQNPTDRHLRNQSALCYSAQIGTIHSFCTAILRENAHLLGIVPDFKVLDEDRADTIKSGVLEKLLDASYEKIGEDPGFALLVDTVGAGRDDARLIKIVLSLYTRMQSHAYPEEWAKAQAEAMKIAKGTDAVDTPWGRELMAWARSCAAYWAQQLDALISGLVEDETKNEAVIAAYAGSILESAEAIRDLCRALDAGWDRAKLQLPVPFPRLKAIRGERDEETVEYVKARREACKKDMAKLAELFADSSTELMDDLERTRSAMEALLSLAVNFTEAYEKEKRRLGCLDFSDLEHMALRLLIDKATGERTWLALELSQRYVEIMADEYQDVNAVQDMIINAVSREGRNIFMVGDVKQSIYRFRLADPGIFIGKYLSFEDADPEKPGEPAEGIMPSEAPPRRILLQENFRSRASVLEAVNHVFSNMMSRELGELDYDESARLKPGAAEKYPAGGECPVELSILELPESGGGEEAPDKTELEARFVARRIRALVDSGALVGQQSELRAVDYGDIVILLRSPGASGPAYRRALEEAGVPVVSEQGGDFFGSMEISVMISLLAAVDNPRQDVPLISVLRSPFFGFTADELSEIRSRDMQGDFYSALLAAAGEREKTRDFLALLDSLRAQATDMPTDRLLWQIYNKTSAFAVCAAMEGSEQRRENLMRLFEYARKFEESGYRGLFRFTAWLRRLMERGEEPPASRRSDGSAVRIMSIHKSKGLEFPVVFLCDASRRFNKSDLTENVLVHPELGLGPKLTDTDRGIEYPTLARNAIARRLNRELLSEEMRVLYVAMTRAKERLYISCGMKQPERAIGKLAGALSSPIAPQLLETAQSPAQWLLMCAMLDGGGLIAWSIENPAEEDKAEEAQERRTASDEAAVDEETYLALKKRLDYRYPHMELSMLPSKLTATELKGLPGDAESDPEAALLAPRYADYDFAPPEFVTEQSGTLTGAQRGTATHVVMQHIDFTRTGTPESVRSEIERISSLGHLSEAEAHAVDARAVLDFFRSDIGRRILAADEVLREFRFSLLYPAKEFFDCPDGEEILLQGVVDCCIEENGELTIIDYKTDYVNQNTIKETTDKYRPQLCAYAGAMTRISEKPVRQAFLYYLRAGAQVEVDLKAQN